MGKIAIVDTYNTLIIFLFIKKKKNIIILIIIVFIWFSVMLLNVFNT